MIRLSCDVQNLLTRTNGISVSTLAVCNELNRRNIDISLFWVQKPNILPQSLKYAKHHFGNHRGSLSRLAWQLYSLPRQINSNHTDLFWGPAHRLPIGLGKSVTCVVTIHDLVWAKYPTTMRRRGWLADRVLSPHAMRRADAIIAVSKSTRDDIVERFPHYTAKVHVIYPGTSTFEHSQSDVDDDYASSALGNYALFVGTIEPRKNLDRLLQAIAKAKAEDRASGKLRSNAYTLS